jgi:hypothetical protein
MGRSIAIVLAAMFAISALVAGFREIKATALKLIIGLAFPFVGDLPEITACARSTAPNSVSLMSNEHVELNSTFTTIGLTRLDRG